MDKILQVIKEDGCCSVSEGTLQNQDLIPKFLNILKVLNSDAYEAIVSPANGHSVWPHYARDNEEDNWWESQEAYDFLSTLEESISELSPSGFYFGAHEGDAAKFGFWPYSVNPNQ